MFKNAWIEAITRHNDKMYEPHIVLGDRVTMSNNVHISCVALVSIGDDVLLGSNIYIADHNHGTYDALHPTSPDEPPGKRAIGVRGSLIIGKNVWIGDNVTIVGNLEIGEGAIIGANSVVRASIPARTIAFGNPARPQKSYDHEVNVWRRV